MPPIVPQTQLSAPLACTAVNPSSPGSAKALAEALCSQIRSAQRTATLPPLPALHQQVWALGQLDVAGLGALVQVLEVVGELRAAAPNAPLAEYLESHLQLRIIEAAAQAAQNRPAALHQAYRTASAPSLKDSLCEAAARLSAQHPKTIPQLLPMMLDHLEENAFVASLCLAESGHAAALPRLQARLRTEVLAPPAKPPCADTASLRALHVEGLVESIEALGGRVEPALLPLVARASAQGRQALAPLLALAPELAPGCR